MSSMKKVRYEIKRHLKIKKKTIEPYFTINFSSHVCKLKELLIYNTDRVIDFYYVNINNLKKVE